MDTDNNIKELEDRIKQLEYLVSAFIQEYATHLQIPETVLRDNIDKLAANLRTKDR